MSFKEQLTTKLLGEHDQTTSFLPGVVR